jgi:hypothetical protein
MLIKVGPAALGGKFGVRVSSDVKLVFGPQPLEVPEVIEYEVTVGKGAARSSKQKRVNARNLLRKALSLRYLVEVPDEPAPTMRERVGDVVAAATGKTSTRKSSKSRQK